MNKKDIGELFLVGFPNGIDDEAIQLIKKVRPGGIILYPKNMKDMHNLEISINILYELMEREGLRFFITSDHEGGQVETIPGILPFPGNAALGRTKEEYVTLYGTYLGKTLKNIGFNTLFAPVLDVLHETSSPVTGLRAFSHDPKKVATYGTLFIDALQKEGIIATAKHFPGHGKADADSHKVLPIVKDFGKEDPDLFPFKEAVEHNVGMVMTAHIIYPQLDTLPATLSEKILKGILREKLGYKGIIISDAIEMQALYDNYSVEEMIKRFFDAGGDIFLVADGKKNLKRSYDALIMHLENGEIEEKILEKSIGRIRTLKEKYVQKTYPNLFLYEVATFSQKVNIKSEIKDEPLFLIPSSSALSPADTTNIDISKYEDVVRLLFRTPRVVKYDIFTGETDGPVEESETIVSLTVDSFRFEGQKRLQLSLPDRAKRVIYIILRDPKDQRLYEKYEYIVTYSIKPISLYQALKKIKNY